MMIINQFSFVIAAVGFFILIAVLILRQGVDRKRLIVLGIFAASMVGGWFAVRPGPSTLRDLAEFDAALGSGQPIVLEYQSEFCMGCIALQPMVAEMKATYGEDVVFIQVNAYDALGRTLAERYALAVTPTIVYFDASGMEVGRTIATIDAARIEETIE